MNALNSSNRHELLGGSVLILLGVLFLVGQWLPTQIGLFIPLLVGLVLLTWGIVARHVGPIIPGGIVTGVGIGVLLVELLFPQANDAIFLLGFSLGWVIITVASALFTKETHWWPLIVAAIMLVVGAAATWGGILMTLLTWTGSLWPLALIIIGIYLILRHNTATK